MDGSDTFSRPLLALLPTVTTEPDHRSDVKPFTPENSDVSDYFERDPMIALAIPSVISEPQFHVVLLDWWKRGALHTRDYA